MLRVRRYGARFTFRGLWAGAQAAMQPTPGLSFEGRLLAGATPAGFSEAAFARLIGTKRVAWTASRSSGWLTYIY